ncbi:MAG: hypothetical protein JST39_15115 [Bacteroidetes bacterium]|nr:hypothetical protein [Bacteroidota bacterium]
MHLTTSDWIGFSGVAILLVAYLFNLLGKLSRDGKPYILLNILGAALSCLASVLIHYMPFVLLEAVWTLVSIGALVNGLRGRKAS